MLFKICATFWVVLIGIFALGHLDMLSPYAVIIAPALGVLGTIFAAVGGFVLLAVVFVVLVVLLIALLGNGIFIFWSG